MKQINRIFILLLALILCVPTMHVNAKNVEIIDYHKVDEIVITRKLPLNKVKEKLPKTLEVVTENLERKEIAVDWIVEGDYNNTNYTYYQFDAILEDGYELCELLDIPYVDVVINPSTISTLSVTGNQNEDLVYDWCINTMGVNNATACGILANIQAESAFNPTASYVEAQGFTSFGICQWNNSRYNNLVNFCNSNGYNYRTIEGQLAYLRQELLTTEKYAWSMMQNLPDTAEGAYTAGYNWARYFERCASQYYTGRAVRARDVYWIEYTKVKIPVDPKGHCDLIGHDDDLVKVGGWTYDPDIPNESILVRVYIDGKLMDEVECDFLREDVNQAFGITGIHGFNSQFYSPYIGEQVVSVYAFDEEQNKEVLIGEDTINIEISNEIIIDEKLYDDCDQDDWYYEAVKYAYENNLMTGYGGTNNFGPNDYVTREQMVQVLYNLENQPDVASKAGTEKFADVYQGAWFEDAINWAYENGITVGMGDRFGVGSKLTREQMVIFLNNYAKFKGIDTKDASDLSSYKDYTTVDDWASEAMSWAVAKGIITGVIDGDQVYLDPIGNATRAQLASILQRFLTN